MSLTVARQTLSASAAGLANASAFSSLVRVFQESSRLELAEHAVVLAVVLSVTNTAYKVRFIVSCPSTHPCVPPSGSLVAWPPALSFMCALNGVRVCLLIRAAECKCLIASEGGYCDFCVVWCSYSQAPIVVSGERRVCVWLCLVLRLISAVLSPPTHRHLQLGPKKTVGAVIRWILGAVPGATSALDSQLDSEVKYC
jgi:hypothetical protein